MDVSRSDGPSHPPGKCAVFEPGVKHVLKGWAENGKIPRHDLRAGDLRVTNVPTNIREPDSVEVSVYLCPPEDDVVCRLRDAGIDRVIFLVAPQARDAALAEIDQHTELMARCA